MTHTTGKIGYVIFGPVQIGGQAGALAGHLRRMADELERPTNRSSRSLLQQFPKELDRPETAWPWLLENRPWLFTGINIKSEPYYHYLEDAGQQNTGDDLQVALEAGCTSDSSKADIAEALTGSRKYGGQDYYDRILPVWEALQSSSSTEKANIIDFKRVEAA